MSFLLPLSFIRETIIAKTKLLKELNLDFSHKFHFAVKANPNLAILNLLKRQGLVLR